jgi:uncharacterized membrane protein YbhN (UPF0104 family)
LQPTSLKKIINYSISISITVWLCWLISKQLKQQAQLQETLQQLFLQWTPKKIILIVFVFIGMFINWSIEAIKWQMLLSSFQKINFMRSLRSVFTGISVSILTPNRIGEYAGRLLYVPNKHKLDSVAANLVSSFAQFIAASSFGLIGCIFYQIYFPTLWYMPWVIAATSIGFIILLFAYFRLPLFVTWLSKFSLFSKMQIAFSSIQQYPNSFLRKLILLSALRYTIFALQYYCLLQAFSIHIILWQGILSVFVIFWLMAILPTIALAELPVRTELSYTILQVFSANAVGIMSASILLWLINLIIPAILGAIALIGLKWQEKKESVG